MAIRHDAKLAPMLQAAAHVVQALQISTILLLTDGIELLRQLDTAQPFPGRVIVWGVGDSALQQWLKDREYPHVVLPHTGMDQLQRIIYSTLTAVAHRLLAPDEVVLCLSGTDASRGLNLLRIFRPDEEIELLRHIDWQSIDSDIDPQVLWSIIDLAITMGSVRHLRVSGTMFIIGDTDNVLRMSELYQFEPFHCYAREQRQVRDPAVRSTLEKFMRLDGAFVVAGDGTVEALIRSTQPPRASDQVPAGLGGRHAAAGAITVSTRAYAVTVSESAGNVKVWKDGKVVLALTPR